MQIWGAKHELKINQIENIINRLSIAYILLKLESQVSETEVIDDLLIPTRIQILNKKEYAMKFVIIGGDAAGMSAASRVKRTMPDVKVTVFEKTLDVSYSA
jgi:hypothetical protein